MKRYKNLWEQFVSMENLELAAKKAVQSKKSKWTTKRFLKNKQQLLAQLQKMLIDGTFNTSKYKIIKIFEGIFITIIGLKSILCFFSF